jgi:hypothetical protein
MRNFLKIAFYSIGLALMGAMIGAGYADAPKYPHSNAGN